MCDYWLSYRWRLRFDDGRCFRFLRLCGLLRYARKHGHRLQRSAVWTYQVRGEQ